MPKYYNCQKVIEDSADYNFTEIRTGNSMTYPIIEEQRTMLLEEYRDVKSWLFSMCQVHKTPLDFKKIAHELDTIRSINNIIEQEQAFIEFFWSNHFDIIRQSYWARRTLWSRLYLALRIPVEKQNLAMAVTEMIYQLEQKKFDGLGSEDKKNLLQNIAKDFQIIPGSQDFFKFLSAFSAPSIARVNHKDIGSIEGKDKDVVRRGILHDAKNHIAASNGFVRHILKVLKEQTINIKEDSSTLEKISSLKDLLYKYKDIAEEIETILLHYLAGEIQPEKTIQELTQQKRIQRLKDIMWALKSFSARDGDEREFVILKSKIKNDMNFSMSNANKAIELMRMVTNVWLGWSMMHINIYNFIDDILTEKQKQLLRNKGINLCWFIDDNVPNRKVFLYERILQTALLELILNAEKYSQASLLQVFIRLKGNNLLEVIVSDNGQGISPEILKNLFKPYSTVASTKYTGTGLGLSSIKDTIEGVGGEIELESRLGEGTSFCFRLPINDLSVQIPREKITGESRIIAITGLAGNHRKVVARWLAGELGLRYINVGFLIRVLTYYLLKERPHLIYSLKEVESDDSQFQKVKLDIVLYVMSFLDEDRIDYAVEPIVIDGKNTAFMDEEGFSLRRSINETIDRSKENTELFHMLTNFCEIRQVINYFLGRLSMKIRRMRQHNGIVAIYAEPLQIADINIVLTSSVQKRGERKRYSPQKITMLDVETGGVRRLIFQVYLSDIMIDTTKLLAGEVVRQILNFLEEHGNRKSQRKEIIMKSVDKGSFPREIIMGCVNMTDNDRLNRISWELKAIKNTNDKEDRIEQLKDLYLFLNHILKRHLWEKSLWARLYLSTTPINEDYVFQGLCHFIDALDQGRLVNKKYDIPLELKISQVADEVIRQFNLSVEKQNNLMKHFRLALRPPA